MVNNKLYQEYIKEFRKLYKFLFRISHNPDQFIVVKRLDGCYYLEPKGY